MLLPIPELLSAPEVLRARTLLDQAEWVDGRVTAGRQSALSKDNMQLPEDSSAARELGGDGSIGLGEERAVHLGPRFLRGSSRRCSIRYQGGQSFGTHVDNAIRTVTGTAHRIRTDLSATLFFTGPDEYDGGELVVEDTYGTHSVKLPAGHLILYPATSLHHVRPVTRGARLASFFWIQSMVRDDGDRTLLFDLDVAIQRLNGEGAPHPAAVPLTGVYHNLLRRWAEV
ncbi:MAG: Fe2+-dependent dioxygenase [Ignavibacteriota bacterium]